MEWFLFLLLGYALWRWFGHRNNSTGSGGIGTVAGRDERQQGHLSHALKFVREKERQAASERQCVQQAAENERRKQDQWERKHAASRLDALHALSGVEFEEFLAGLFLRQGYRVKHTPGSGDYGADLILEQGEERIALQAKRYKNAVGVDAIQQVVAARGYYHCQKAWVVTTAVFTPNARSLAMKNDVT
ncbi:MAG TPA: restriction endonuclease, partial [Gammaproteobacteria bacterium]|nr:restriction endonuclease [Gammaproteobacteria bacterium]